MGQRRGTPRRVDANHAEIVSALRSIGCAVLDLSAVGGGVPDLLVQGVDGTLVLIEIKVAKGRLNRLQQQWHDSWRGAKPVIVRTVAEAMTAVGVRGV